MPGIHRSVRTRAPRRVVLPVLLAFLVLVFMAGSAGSSAPPNEKADAGLQNALNALNERARAYGLANQAPPSEATPVLADNFQVLGHNDLGARDTNGDVWVHGNFAYVGTWSDPCTGRGVKVIDVSNLTAPRVIGAVATRQGTSAEDMVVRHVSTPYFTGDLLAVGLQRCGSSPTYDRQTYGPEFWDVTNPYRPRKLSAYALTHGGGGVHELDLIQRGNHVYALLASPFSEWLDPVPVGDFVIVDVTNPRTPVKVGEWGAGAHGFTPGPFWGQGSFGASFDHSARASADGTKAYVSYWDLGVVTLDIRDVTNPVFVSRTHYAPDDDGEAHSVSKYRGFLLQNDEDFDPRSPVHLLYGGTTGVGNESPLAPAIWLESGHAVSGAVVQAANQGCDAADYPAGTAGKIAVVKSPFQLLSEPSEERLCDQGTQELAAQAAGAAAVVHDFISTDTSPQWWDPAEVSIPVVFTDHATAQGLVAAGSATLEAQTPSWGYLRVFDAASGTQVAKFDGVPNVHALPPPAGDWSIHNNEVLGNRSYASWYSNGIVALDLSPLRASPIGNPVKVGQFIPAGAPSHTDFIASGVPNVWGVAIRASDHTIFASDLNSGLWIVRPTGPAAP
jgi:hypothetical protein